jgi:hypothetical protein
VKTELRKHLTPLIAIFVVISVYWIFKRVAFYEFFFLFFGLGLGSFFLDLDHIVYWLYLNPNIEESRLAQIALKKYDFTSIIKLLESTHKQHVNLIFHHFFFQVVLALISVFVFTSSSSAFGMGFLLALNIHLIVDEFEDYRRDKAHLQNWLFAREDKQLPARYLSRYIMIFAVLSFVFTWLLLKSKS